MWTRRTWHTWEGIATIQTMCSTIMTSPLPSSVLSLVSSLSSRDEVSVSTGIRKLTNECCEIVARMLALQLRPDEIAVLVGVSVRSVYCIWVVCEENGEAYNISRMPSNAGRPALILEDDVNICVIYTQFTIRNQPISTLVPPWALILSSRFLFGWTAVPPSGVPGPHCLNTNNLACPWKGWAIMEESTHVIHQTHSDLT